MHDYELMMVLSPELDESGMRETVERVKRAVAQKGGTLTHEEVWGRRRFAYPIGKFTEGTYVLTRFQMEPVHARELEGTLKVTEEVIRHLLIKPQKVKAKKARKERQGAKEKVT